jgi:membrane protease YdiL (CAAX protease family)
MFKNSFGEFRCGWAIAIGLITIVASQFVADIITRMFYTLSTSGGLSNLGALPPGMSLTDTFAILNMMISSVINIIFVILLFRLLYKKPMVQLGFGMNRAALKFFSGLLQGACYMAIVFILLFALGGLTVVSISPERILSASIVLGLIDFLIAALSEEVLCRGFMMTASKSTRSKAFIIIVPALVFSLLHVLNPGFTVLPMINIFLAGVLFAVLFVRSGSLWMPFGFHFAWNFFQGNIFGISVSGNEVKSMIEISYTDLTLLNGGTFGAEGGLAVTILLAVGIVLTWKFMKPAKDAQWSMEGTLSERAS